MKNLCQLGITLMCYFFLILIEVVSAW